MRTREGRRIIGDYRMTIDDVEAGRKFKDVIGKSASGASVDGGHSAARPGERKKIPKRAVRPKDDGSWDIPYRMLVPKNVENLLVAGKMISAERDAYLRFLPETMVTGQAAGVAAAVCAKKGITPRELEKDVSELQEILVKQGAILTGTH
jgi:hypothetical protein